MDPKIKTVNPSQAEDNINTTSETSNPIKENTGNFADASTKIISEEETKNTLPTDIIQKMWGTEEDKKEAMELYEKYSWNKEQLDNWLKEIVGNNVSDFMKKLEEHNMNNSNLRDVLWKETFEGMIKLKEKMNKVKNWDFEEDTNEDKKIWGLIDKSKAYGRAIIKRIKREAKSAIESLKENEHALSYLKDISWKITKVDNVVETASKNIEARSKKNYKNFKHMMVMIYCYKEILKQKKEKDISAFNDFRKTEHKDEISLLESRIIILEGTMALLYYHAIKWQELWSKISMKREELQLGFQETMFHVSENGQAQIDQKVIEQMMDLCDASDEIKRQSLKDYTDSSNDLYWRIIDHTKWRGDTKIQIADWMKKTRLLIVKKEKELQQLEAKERKNDLLLQTESKKLKELIHNHWDVAQLTQNKKVENKKIEA
jgi:hypothetical protein